jgi:hypothetical protein
METTLKNDFINEDAAEMHSILRSAVCIERYDSISHQLLSELLVAIATEGEVVGGNNRGSDVFSSKFGKIEVKSRILGTDGPFPRVSLKPHNIEKADWFVAIRWTRDFQFHAAWMLPKSAASTLHASKKQGSGLAHISWESWKAGVGAIDLSDKIITALTP